MAVGSFSEEEERSSSLPRSSSEQEDTETPSNAVTLSPTLSLSDSGEDSSLIRHRRTKKCNDTSDDNHDNSNNNNNINNNSNNSNSNSNNNNKHKNVFPLWSKFTDSLRTLICSAVVALGMLAGRNPKRTVAFVPILSFTMLLVGFMTNFQFETDIDGSFRPLGSIAVQHNWKIDNGPFSSSNRNDAYANATLQRPHRTNLGVLLHASDNDILGNDAIQKLFQIIDTFRSVPAYDRVCHPQTKSDDNNNHGGYGIFEGCNILGVTKLWNNNLTLYNDEIANANDQLHGFGFKKVDFGFNNKLDTYYRDLIIRKFKTTTTFPDDGIPVDYGIILDTLGTDSIQDIAIPNEQKFVHAYFIIIQLLQTHETKQLISEGLSELYKLNDKWLHQFNYEQQRLTQKLQVKGTNATTSTNVSIATALANPNNMTAPYRVEGIPFSTALADGLIQTVLADVPLMPIAICTMMAFTCIVFFRCHRVHSRIVLALCSVVTIVLSICTAFGILFWIGIPFAATSTIVPFVIIGVGLDDTFIITGHFFHLGKKEMDDDDSDEETKVLNKLRKTLSTVGMSIFVTTVTTTLAFMLGLMSDIPAIRWLVTYAFTCIIIDFIYQITFFVAILVLDERRIRANRCDVLCCFKGKEDQDNRREDGDVTTNNGKRINFMDRFMVWYSNQLMRRDVKAAVLISFLLFFSGCAYSGTKIKQAFRPVDLVSENSDIFRFYDAWAKYNRRPFPIEIYFEDVDQSDPYVRQQMKDYIYDLLDTNSLGNGKREPTLCWVTEFDKLYSNGKDDSPEWFYEQLDMLLDIPLVNEVFGSTIVRDPTTGHIIASKCLLSVYNVEMNSVDSQIEFLREIREVTTSQPINQKNLNDPSSWSFYTYSDYYLLFEFYTVHVKELISTTVAGMLSVAVVTLVFVPHWSATIFVLPLMITLYVDLLGTLQFCGIKLNVITFVVLVVSIGLLVDFIIHVLLAYYESTEKTREGKVKDALRTLGSSICVGGISTFLCIVPLAGSASFILKTVYICFLAMVVLGISYGLILLPVILSIVGPINNHSHYEQPDSDMDVEPQPKKRLDSEDLEPERSHA